MQSIGSCFGHASSECENPIGYTLDHTFCNMAAMNGDLKTLIWARKHKYEWNSETLCDAIYSGKIDLVKWMIQNECPESINACYAATVYGHLPILIFLRENGYYWDEEISICAAENRRLDMLQWAIMNGCPYNKETILRISEDDKKMYDWMNQYKSM